MNSYKLKKPKSCSCGNIHTQTCGEVKISTDVMFAGIYWNCLCGSTMFVKPDAILTAAEELDAA